MGEEGECWEGFLLEPLGDAFGSRGDCSLPLARRKWRDVREGNKESRYPYLFPLEASISLQPWEARGPLEGEGESASETHT